MELDFDEIFKTITTCLNITRAHPYIRRDKKWAFQFFILHGIFTVSFVNMIYNILYHDLKSNDFSQTCKNGVFVVVYIVITFQYCVLLWHQDEIVGLINNMKRDYEHSKHLNAIERDIFIKYVHLAVWVCKQWVVVATLGTGVFILKSFSLMLYYYCIGEFKLVSIYDLVYPSIIEKHRDTIGFFVLNNALLTMFGCYSSVMYAGYVPLGPIFMLHACAQLELVKIRIDDLFVVCDDQVIKRKLNSIIIQLQYIYSFVGRTNQIFMIAYELTLKATTLMLPITCYEVLEAFSRGEVSLEFITFITASILFSSCPCYYSDLLMEKGENLRLSLYTCGWELYYDRRSRSTLLLMMQYALRPVAIQTIFRVMCLEALTDLFQQSYTIFNLMNAMWG